MRDPDRWRSRRYAEGTAEENAGRSIGLDRRRPGLREVCDRERDDTDGTLGAVVVKYAGSSSCSSSDDGY